MIRLLLICLMIGLAPLSFLLQKNAKKFATALGSEDSYLSLTKLFHQFSTCLFILTGLGLIFIFLNTQVSALFYLVSIMLVSAVFSLKISKNISL